MLHRYYIHANTTEGVDVSYFVDAPAPAAAVEIWQKTPLMGMYQNTRTMYRVFLLPPMSTEPRGLAWHEEVVVAGQLGATVH